MDHFAELRRNLKPLRDQLTSHPLYITMREQADLNIFMEGHIYAVWDFMSLLKGLQSRLTRVDFPWYPVGNPLTRKFINEIVAGEESDVDQDGNPASHFELYRKAMQESGARTEGIDHLLGQVQAGVPIERAIMESKLPGYVAHFLNHTFSVLQEDDLIVLASTFTFGREDLIPDLFSRMVTHLVENGNESLRTFQYYLERHIEVDGEDHGPMAEAMIREICGEDLNAWSECLRAADDALRARIGLWNGIHEEMLTRNAVLN